jgi:hypothetical protein
MIGLNKSRRRSQNLEEVEEDVVEVEEVDQVVQKLRKIRIRGMKMQMMAKMNLTFQSPLHL